MGEEKKKCPQCGSMYSPRKRGLHNLKNLWAKPTLNDFIMLFILAMVFFAAWGYTEDMKAVSEILEGNCVKTCQLEEFKQNWLANNPGKNMICDFETFSCSQETITESYVPLNLNYTQDETL